MFFSTKVSQGVQLFQGGDGQLFPGGGGPNANSYTNPYNL